MAPAVPAIVAVISAAGSIVTAKLQAESQAKQADKQLKASLALQEDEKRQVNLLRSRQERLQTGRAAGLPRETILGGNQPTEIGRAALLGQ